MSVYGAQKRVIGGPPKSSSMQRLDATSGGSATGPSPAPSRRSLQDTVDTGFDEELLAEAATMSPPRARPERPVYLITADRNDPLKRTTRDVTRQHKPRHDAHGERKQRDDLKDMIETCQAYKEHFNTLLRKLPRRDKRVVLLVMDRMKREHIPMDETTYNLLLEKVVDLRDPIAFEIFEEFKSVALMDDDTTVRPDQRTFELMVRACERNGDYRRAFHVYNQMKDLRVYPDVQLYNSLIGFCAPLRDETTASFIIEEMNDRKVEPDVHTYNALMNVFADAPYELVLQAFDDMVKRKLKPNRRTFNTLMKACQRIGDYDRVFQFFEEMKQEDIQPDVTTYNVLIVACRDRLEYVMGTGKFSDQRRTKQQREVGVQAIARLCRSLLDEMDSLSIAPNTFTYNALLSVHSQCRDRNLFDIFGRMQEDEERLANTARSAARQAYISTDPGMTPDFPELERMLEQAIQESAQTGGGGGGSAAEDMQGDRMGAVGVRSTIETYATVIQGSHRMEMPAKAFELFAKMKLKGIKPNRDIFVRLIDVCATKAEKQRAFDLFDECRQEGIAPDTELFNALLNVLAECCDPRVHDTFVKLKHDTEGLSVKPNQDSYNLMLKAALKTRRLEDANRLYEEMTSPSCPVAPDTVSYGIIMDICAACKDVKRAGFFIEDMRRRHIATTINTYSRFMRVFVAAGDPGVVDVFENMKKHGPKPNLEAYTTLLQYYLATANDAIYALFEDMRKEGVDPDLNAYNTMLNFAAIKHNEDRAYMYLHQLTSMQLEADIDTYNALMAVFAPNGGEMVHKVFEDMARHHVAPDATTLGILMKHPRGRIALSEAAARGLVKIESIQGRKE